MANRKRPGRAKKAAKVIFSTLLVVAFAGAAVFGVYRLATAALDQEFPGMKPSAAPSSAPSSSSSAAPGSAPASSQAMSSESPSVELSGIFSGYSDDVSKKLAAMTLREKVGQVFLFEAPASGAVKTIDDDQPAGYCLSARDFENKTKDDVIKLLKSYQNSSKIPMILTCDEEGGTVVRISKFPALATKPFQSSQQVFKAGGMAAITSDTVKKAQLLKSLGLNVNLAPVADVSTNPKDFMYERAFGKDAAQTSDFVTATIKAYESQDVSYVLKHFPGYGNNGDTHTAAVHDTRSYQTFQQSDFLPFEAGISAGAPAVMVNHNVVESMDAKHPASLSPQVHNILRNTLGFTGVIVTDDLTMDAVTDYTKGKNAAVEAFLAGNDLLLTTDIAPSYSALLAAVQDGTVSEKRLDESVARVLAWKYQAGIL